MTKLAHMMLSILTLASTNWSAAAHADALQDGEASWPVDPDVSVEIEVISGRIELRGWDRDEFRVEARGRGAKSLRVDSSNRRISVRSPGRRFGWIPWTARRGSIDLKIDLPKGSRVTARTFHGPILASDVTGTVDFYTADGQIEVVGAPREAWLETINAGIELKGRETRVEARTVNGSIDLQGVAEEVRASTISGSIDVEGDLVHRIELETFSGSIELAVALDRQASVRVKSMNGDLKLELPADTSARFKINTFNGTIENELAATSESSRHHGPGNELRFEAGEGSGRVRLETFNGNVEIERSGD
jgi:hypothetical protein